jgi:hypothetical protein
MILVEANAHCHKCEWNTYGKNAMGNAARHHYKTEHTVGVDLIYIHVFKKREEKKSKKRSIGKNLNTRSK